MAEKLSRKFKRSLTAQAELMRATKAQRHASSEEKEGSGSPLSPTDPSSLDDSILLPTPNS